jgi:hypothetical protein
LFIIKYGNTKNNTLTEYKKHQTFPKESITEENTTHRTNSNTIDKQNINYRNSSLNIGYLNADSEHLNRDNQRTKKELNNDTSGLKFHNDRLIDSMNKKTTDLNSTIHYNEHNKNKPFIKDFTNKEFHPLSKSSLRSDTPNVKRNLVEVQGLNYEGKVIIKCSNCFTRIQVKIKSNLKESFYEFLLSH